MLIFLIYWFLRIYSLIVIARVLLSWFPNVDRSNPIVQFLYDVTEPLLQPIRDFLRQQFPDMGPFDFSPLVLLVGIMVLQQILFAAF
jgi:YggT family protein